MEITFIDRNNKPLIERVIVFLSLIKHLYPDFDIWFSQKVLPDLQTGKRDICLAMDKDLILSVGIVKYANEEDNHKICTLYVSPSQRNQGYGHAIMEKMLEKISSKDTPRRIYLTFLETQQTLISFYERFGFILTSINNGVCYMEKI